MGIIVTPKDVCRTNTVTLNTYVAIFFGLTNLAETLPINIVFQNNLSSFDSEAGLKFDGADPYGCSRIKKNKYLADAASVQAKTCAVGPSAHMS